VKSDALKADLLLVIVTLLAAAGWIFSKEALQGFPPLLFIAIRFSLAGLVLLLIGFSAFRRLDAQGLKRTAGVGLVFGVAMVFWILGLHHGQHLGVGAFLTSIGVVLVPLVALCFGERPDLSCWLALPVAAAGLACLSLDSQFAFGWGEYAFLAAAVLFALYFNLNSRAAAKTSAVALAAIQLIFVGLIGGLVSVFVEPWDFQQPPAIWGWLAASILIATSLRFFVQTYAQGLAPASHAAIIMTLEPVWAALLGAWWFLEEMSAMQFIGCGLILLALLVNRGRMLLRWLRGADQARIPSA